MQSNPKPGRLPVTAAALSLVIGLAVLGLGWGLNIKWLLSPLPGGVSMKPVTAAALVIYGLALGVGLHPGISRVWRSLMQVLVAVIVLLATTILVGLALQAVRGDPVGFLPPRMSISAALPQLLNGLALIGLLESRAKWARPALEQILALISMVIVLPLFIGVILTFGQPGETANYSTLAPHSALTLTLLALGIFFARPVPGTAAGFVMADTNAGRMLRRLLVAGLALPMLDGACERLALNLGFPVALHIGVFATLQIVVLSVQALFVGGILRRTDRLRNVAEKERTAALRQLEYQAATLQETVSRRTTELSQALAYNQRLALVASHTTDAVYITDAQGEAVWANERFGKLFGYSLAEIQGRRPSYLIEGRLTDQATLAKLRSSVATDTGGRGELVLYAKDGTHFWCEAEMQPVRETGGRTSGWVISLSDIQARKAADKQLRAAKEEAEQLNSQLENAIARAQQSAIEANIGSQAKSAFLATMSHEIRTPLNGIIGMAGLLRDTGLDVRQMDFVRTIETSGDALLAIINDVLDYSKIEAGRIELERAPFALRLCVEEALDMFAPKVAEKNLELLASVARDVPAVVLGDAARLRQIVVNLVGNAIKFTATGEVVVTISAGSADAEGQREITVAVRDTGIGIPADRRDRLFQPFSQVDSSTTRKFGGSGLGLAISRRLAEAMGGRMWVESEPGRGSVFSFTFLAREDSAAVPASNPPGPAVLAGRTVLIVDDNAAVRDWLAGQLTAWGARITACSSGAAALDVLKAGTSFDAVILDRQMPDFDGLQLAQEVRGLPGRSGLPLLLLAALSGGGSPEGFAAVVSKPLKSAALFAALAPILGRATAPVASRQARTAVVEAPPSTLRLLLVEDNPVNQRVATMLLAKLGYQVELAQNGAEAVAALAREPFEVILMDMEMPVMDGCEATRRIRETGSATRPWIVALTANAMNSDRLRAFAAGMNDFVAKPIRVADLQSALQRGQAATRGDAVAAEIG
jgi:PAS domain S-box-containing protein